MFSFAISPKVRNVSAESNGSEDLKPRSLNWERAMPEAFAGNLAQVSLADVIRLIHLGNKTGRLELIHEVETADLYFRNGELVAALCSLFIGERAVFYIAQWKSGIFRFYLGEEILNININEDFELLIQKIQLYIDKSREIKEVISSPYMIFKQADESYDVDVTLKTNDWKILSLINGRNTVNDIIAAMGLNDVEVHTRLFRLYKLGLVEIDQKPAQITVETVPCEFFERLSHELTKIMGPIAEFLIDEYLEQFGMTRSLCSKNMAGQLVDKIGNEITNEEQRLMFQKNLLAWLTI
jgi:hypothetical protein